MVSCEDGRDNPEARNSRRSFLRTTEPAPRLDPCHFLLVWAVCIASLNLHITLIVATHVNLTVPVA
jgi:hypothetical protein